MEKIINDTIDNLVDGKTSKEDAIKTLTHLFYGNVNVNKFILHGIPTFKSKFSIKLQEKYLKEAARKFGFKNMETFISNGGNSYH